MKATRATRTVAIIPARYGSRRFPGKPLADIAGKPMLAHVMERVAQATLVNEVLVATDDARIAAVVTAYGGKAVMTPVEIASGTDRIALAARSLEGTDLIVNVQGDEPLISPAMIDEAIMPLLRDPAIEVGTVVKRIEDIRDFTNPHVPKVVLDRAGNCLYFSRSPIPYGRDVAPAGMIAQHALYKHVGLYVFRRGFLLRYASMQPTPLEQAEKLEQLRILEHGHRIHAVVTAYESVSVDTPEDLERVRALMV